MIDYNTGSCNSGNYNTGSYNSGNYNTGGYNSGNSNSGCHNSGCRNTGEYNSGDYNAGFFCTETPKPTFFDKSCDLSWNEAYDRVPYLPINLNGKTYHEAFRKAWDATDATTRQKFLDLPNFDAEKFLAITGVDVREKEAECCDGVVSYELTITNDWPAMQYVMVNGVRYVREVKP
jgi:hypothetical protein